MNLGLYLLIFILIIVGAFDSRRPRVEDVGPDAVEDEDAQVKAERERVVNELKHDKSDSGSQSSKDKRDVLQVCNLVK